MDESCRIQTLCLGCIKICVAAYKTATLKKSNFLGSPQNTIRSFYFGTSRLFEKDQLVL